jgi:hypothetical protein
MYRLDGVANKGCRHWDHELSIPSLLTLTPAPPPTVLTFVRAGLGGRVTGYTEVCHEYTSLFALLLCSH